MCELVMRRALSIELEEHLVNQVLKVEDGRFAYIDDALVLVARILIIRTSTRSSLGDDSLRFVGACLVLLSVYHLGST